MVRTDNDTWDLASSVGATATMAAPARAMASRVDCGRLLSGSSIRELFGAHGLPPFDNEDMAGFADHRYISGILGGVR
jgi:O-methyltransferase involved in polyketide biosynthesis